MKKLISLLALLVLPVMTNGQTEDELGKTFQQHIEIENAGSSVVMVEVSEKGPRFVSFGTISKDPKGAKVDENTIFEIGSITKVFTGILLAEAVRRGEVKLDDPISKFLPASVKTPAFNGKEITLLDLATHSSSLPRMPDNLNPKSGLDPYADYTSRELYDFLSKHKLAREIGSAHDYSNLAFGLLGHVLSLAAKTSYEQLITDRILTPLKMNDTSISLSAAKKSRYAQGLNQSNEPTGFWNFDVLAGAGALRTTASDMAKFIAADLGFTNTPLAASMAEARVMRRKGQNEQTRMGLGWSDVKLWDTQVFWHGGGTYGFSSYVAVAPSKKKGVFLVRNWGGENGGQFLESVAFNQIDGRFPVKKPTPPRSTVALSESMLQSYVGVYEIAPDFSLTITREGNRLFLQATGQDKFELFAEKENEFFLKVVVASLIFVKDANGAVTGVVLHQDSQKTPAKKVK